MARSIHDIYEHLGTVALTVDGWSVRVVRGYFVVMLHWINA